MKNKNQIIKLEDNLREVDLENNQILFVRVSDVVDSPKARFEVPLTHEAIVIKGGGDVRYYSSGTHNVFEDKTEIKEWKKGASLEIIYIPKDIEVLLNWGTKERFRYRDDASNKVISVGARGEATVSVVNAEQFYRKVVGTKSVFDLKEFRNRYGETIATLFKDNFLRVLKEKKLTYDQFDTYKKEIGDSISKLLEAEMKHEWGMTVKYFKIAQFDLLEKDMDAIEAAAAERQKAERLKEYLAEIERLDDKQWEREKYLRQLELQDKSAYYEVLKVLGNPDKAKPQVNKCPNCGNECRPTDKFCLRCGKRVSKEPIVCSACGKSNDSSAQFCANCGKKLY